MARLGGLFHLFRTISKAFKKKRCFDNALHEFRRRLPSLVKNSTAQSGTKSCDANAICSHRKHAPRQPLRLYLDADTISRLDM
jgi:hypothetical protein